MKEKLKIIKAITNGMVPKSRMFYFVLPLHLISVMLSWGEWEVMPWIFISTVWMWLAFVTQDMLDDTFNILKKFRELLEESHKLSREIIDFLKKVTKSKKGRPKGSKNKNK